MSYPSHAYSLLSFPYDGGHTEIYLYMGSSDVLHPTALFWTKIKQLEQEQEDDKGNVYFRCNSTSKNPYSTQKSNCYQIFELCEPVMSLHHGLNDLFSVVCQRSPNQHKRVIFIQSCRKMKTIPHTLVCLRPISDASPNPLCNFST